MQIRVFINQGILPARSISASTASQSKITACLFCFNSLQTKYYMLSRCRFKANCCQSRQADLAVVHQHETSASCLSVITAQVKIHRHELSVKSFSIGYSTLFYHFLLLLRTALYIYFIFIPIY